MDRSTLKDLQKVVADAPTAPILDMLAKALSVITRHKKIMVALSGGSDSDVLLHIFHLLDKEKKAHFVFFNTGLEYQATKRHLDYIAQKYDIEIETVAPILPIPTCCQRYGVPFWSKRVSENIYRLQRHNFQWEDEPFDVLVKRYPRCVAALKWWCNCWNKENGGVSAFNIEYTPWLKEFMVQNPPDFLIAAKCCEKAKKGPANRYEAANDFDLNCTGVRKAEGGQRSTGFKTCFSLKEGGASTFRPLFWLSDRDKQDFKTHYGIVNSDCYEVWGMTRTGCCGCPYGKEFERELMLMKQYEPKLHKAAINIFGKSYDYTRRYLEFREQMKTKNGTGQLMFNAEGEIV